jgi:dTDP-4-amino-4,6-dideoxygalactose transaminase
MNMKVDWPLRGHSYTEAEVEAVSRVMRASGQALTQGSHVQGFEQDFARFVGADRAFATMSGAHSLDIAAMLL